MSKKISLKQFLMKSGRFDKVYDCIAAIRGGKVTINNIPITNPNYFFNHKRALVEFDNEKIKKFSNLYFIINKPAGYLSQKSENEKTIYDLLQNFNLPKEQARSLFAVGRLDKDTEGLLIVTNDGNLSNLLTDPKSGITKRYKIILENTISRNQAKMLEKGIEIMIDGQKYKTKKCRIKLAGEKEAYAYISEGKKRQIRKMFEAIGNKVIYLKRVSIGGLALGNLKVGEIMEISKEEIMEKLQY